MLVTGQSTFHRGGRGLFVSHVVVQLLLERPGFALERGTRGVTMSLAQTWMLQVFKLFVFLLK